MGSQSFVLLRCLILFLILSVRMLCFAWWAWVKVRQRSLFREPALGFAERSCLVLDHKQVSAGPLLLGPFWLKRLLSPR